MICNKAAEFKNLLSKNKIFAAPIITLIWLLAIYFIKGIYPFGLGTIIDGDLYQGGVPGYFYLWDVFHGKISIAYDFMTAGGFDRLSVLSAVNPANWFLLLIPRGEIINFVSILLIIKLLIISFTASYTFSRLFKNISAPWLLIGSLIYTFCGYNLQYFTNLDWLDAVAVYPLIILFALNMFKGKSKLPYVISLSYLLIFNTYMAFFTVISLIVFGGLYIFILEEKENRKRSVFSLGAATGASLLASSYSLYLYVSAVLGGARFSIGKGNSVNTDTGAENASFFESIVQMFTQNELNDFYSALMFLGTEIAVASIIWLTVKSVKNKELRKYSLFFIITYLLLFIQRISFVTDILWHFGSHVMFPYRNGYIVGFFAALIFAFCFSNEKFKEGICFKRDAFNLTVPIFAVFSVIFLLPYAKLFYAGIPDYNVLNISSAQRALELPYSMFSLALILPLLIILMMKYKPVKYAVISLTVLSFAAVNSYLLIGHTGDFKRVENYREYYSDCNDVGRNIVGNDILERVNNSDLSLITNYPYISSVASISNWTHSLSKAQMSSVEKLGFSTVYTRTLDSGGTVFSKALLRITDSCSKSELDSNYYEKTKTSDKGINYYSNRFILPAGLVADENIMDIEFSKNTFEYQNEIYKSISNKEQDLFSPLTCFDKSQREVSSSETSAQNISIRGEDKIICYKKKYNIEGKQAVYISANNIKCSVKKITVNGEPLTVYSNAEDRRREKNTEYTTDYNNNALYIGTFENSVCEIEIFALSGEEHQLNIYAMDVGRLKEFCNSYSGEKNYVTYKNGVDIKVSSDKSGIAFVPISYSDNWDITVNGEKAEPICVLGTFLGVNVQNGESLISIRYSSAPAIKLIVFTLLGISAAAAVLAADKKIKQIPKAIEAAVFALFCVICSSAYLILYIIPTVFEIFK